MKILVSGPVQSGKSSYIKYLDPNALNVEARGSDDTLYTVAMDLGSLTLHGFKIFLFGTPGLMRFSEMRDIITCGSDGVIFMFDSVKPEKDKEAIRILNSIRKVLSSDIPIVYVANKQDLEGARYPKVIKLQNDVPEAKKTFAVSAKTGLNVEKSLKYLVNQVYESYRNILEMMKEYEDNIEGLRKELNKNTSEMKDFLNRLEVKKFIDIDRAHKRYKVKEGLEFIT